MCAPKGGLHEPRLQGFTLKAEQYSQITDTVQTRNLLAMRRAVLGLDFHFADGRLRLWTPTPENISLPPKEESRRAERAEAVLQAAEGQARELRLLLANYGSHPGMLEIQTSPVPKNIAPADRHCGSFGIRRRKSRLAPQSGQATRTPAVNRPISRFATVPQPCRHVLARLTVHLGADARRFSFLAN